MPAAEPASTARATAELRFPIGHRRKAVVCLIRGHQPGECFMDRNMPFHPRQHSSWASLCVRCGTTLRGCYHCEKGRP